MSHQRICTIVFAALVAVGRAGWDGDSAGDEPWLRELDSIPSPTPFTSPLTEDGPGEHNPSSSVSVSASASAVPSYAAVSSSVSASASVMMSYAAMSASASAEASPIMEPSSFPEMSFPVGASSSVSISPSASASAFGVEISASPSGGAMMESSTASPSASPAPSEMSASPSASMAGEGSATPSGSASASHGGGVPPTSMPSSEPSSAASSMPSSMPSSAASSAASSMPSSMPSSAVSSMPSSAASSAASSMPSSAASSAASSMPSSAASSAASSMPSSAASSAASSLPSSAPSNAVSSAPSSAASNMPTSTVSASAAAEMPSVSVSVSGSASASAMIMMSSTASMTGSASASASSAGEGATSTSRISASASASTANEGTSHSPSRTKSPTASASSSASASHAGEAPSSIHRASLSPSVSVSAVAPSDAPSVSVSASPSSSASGSASASPSASGAMASSTPSASTAGEAPSAVHAASLSPSVSVVAPSAVPSMSTSTSASASGSASASPSASHAMASSTPSASTAVEAPSTSVSASASVEVMPPSISVSASHSGSASPSASASMHGDMSSTSSVAASSTASVSASAAAEISATGSSSPSPSHSAVPSHSSSASHAAVSATSSSSAAVVPSETSSSTPSPSSSASASASPAAPSGTSTPSASSSASASSSVGGSAASTTTATASASMSGSGTSSATATSTSSGSGTTTSSPLPGVAPLVWLNPDSLLVFNSQNVTGLATSRSPQSLAVWVNVGTGGTPLSAKADVTALVGFPRVVSSTLLNGINVARFDAGPVLTIEHDFSSVDSTIFLVARIADTSAAKRVLTGKANTWIMGWNGGLEDVATVGDQVISNRNSPADTTWRLYTLVTKLGGVTFMRNGNTLGFTQVSRTNQGPNYVRLGGDPGTATTSFTSICEIAELIMYDRAVSPTELLAIQTRLIATYGLAAPSPSASPSPSMSVGASPAPPVVISEPSPDGSSLLLWLQPLTISSGAVSSWANAAGGFPLNNSAVVGEPLGNGYYAMRTVTNSGPFTFQPARPITSYTLFIVARPVNTAGTMLIGDTGRNIAIGFAGAQENVFNLPVAALTPSTYSATASSSTFRLFEVVYDAGSTRARAYRNGALQADVVNTAFLPPSIISIGVGDYDIAEVVLYNVVLSESDRLAREGALAQRYGLQALLPSGNPFASISPGFSQSPTSTASLTQTAGFSAPPASASGTPSNTPSNTPSVTASTSLSGSALPAELGADVTYISFDIKISVDVNLASFTDPAVAKDFRGSIAGFVGLPTRNILIMKIANGRTGAIMAEFTLASPLNRVSDGRRRMAADYEEHAAAKRALLMADIHRALQSGDGITVTNNVIVSDLSGGPVDAGLLARVLGKIQSAQNNPGAMLSSFVSAQGASLGISLSSISVANVASVQGTSSTATPKPTNGTPIAAIAGGAAGGAVVLIGVGVALYFIVFRKRRTAPETETEGDDKEEQLAEGASSAVQPVDDISVERVREHNAAPVMETLYVSPEEHPSMVPTASSGPINVTAVKRV